MRTTKTLLFSLAAVLWFGVRAFGATIDVDTILGADNPYPSQTITIVDGASPPTVVQVVDGALIGGQPAELPVAIGMDVYDSSVVELRGGIVRGLEQAILLHDEAILRMLGGEIDTSLIETRDASRAIIQDGRYRAFRAMGHSRVEVFGGNGNGIAYENATIVQYSGNLDLLLDDQSSFVMHGGFIDEGFQTHGSSRALINGGSIGGLVLMLLNDKSIVTIRGGGLSGEVHLEDEAQLHIYGLGLEFVFDDGRHLVRGTFPDGNRANLEYGLADQDQIILHEVPEPATWGLLAVGISGLVAARWRSTRPARPRQ